MKEISKSQLDTFLSENPAASPQPPVVSSPVSTPAAPSIPAAVPQPVQASPLQTIQQTTATSSTIISDLTQLVQGVAELVKHGSSLFNPDKKEARLDNEQGVITKAKSGSYGAMIDESEKKKLKQLSIEEQSSNSHEFIQRYFESIPAETKISEVLETWREKKTEVVEIIKTQVLSHSNANTVNKVSGVKKVEQNTKSNDTKKESCSAQKQTSKQENRTSTSSKSKKKVAKND